MRTFLPVNREDALVLLAGLGWSNSPWGKFVALPERNGKIATVAEGLRTSEEKLLAAGHDTRFSVLLEIEGQPPEMFAPYIAWRNIISAAFKSDEHRDAFRFRPVAEIDPIDIPCEVDETLFTLDGAPRFGTWKESASQTGTDIADRIGGGMAYVLHLVRSRPALFDTAVSLLSVRRNDDSLYDLVFRAEEHLSKPQKTTLPKDLGIVISAFFEAENKTGREIVELIFDRLTGSADGGDIGAVEGKWFDRAMKLFDNAIELTGREFTDDNRIDLRAALLAAHARQVDAIGAAMDLPVPAGRKVTILAAFLSGLSDGLRNLDWQIKKPAARALSDVAAAVHLRSIGTSRTAHSFSVSIAVDDAVLSFDDEPLVAVSLEETSALARSQTGSLGHEAIEKRQRTAPKSMELEFEELLGRFDLRSPLDGGVPDSLGWRRVILPDGKEIDAKPDDGPDSPFSLTFRRRLAPPRAAAKATNLLSANFQPGLGWRLAMDNKERYAVADLPKNSDSKYLEWLWRQLNEIELRFVRIKAARKKSTRKKNV